MDAVRAARKVLREHHRAIAKRRARVRVVMVDRRRPRFSQALRKFRVFEHDFQTVLKAAVRSGGRSPAAIVRDAELAADRMGEVVSARRPHDADVAHLRYRRRPSRVWQTLFDQMVHRMSENTALSAGEVVRRAERIADLAIVVIEARRPAKAKRAA
jgi:hypothetical protein